MKMIFIVSNEQLTSLSSVTVCFRSGTAGAGACGGGAGSSFGAVMEPVRPSFSRLI